MALNISGVRRKVVVGTVGVLAAGGAFLALGPAGASGSVHTSSITLRYTTGHFTGKVSSDTTDCTVGRKVFVFKRGATANHNPSVGSAFTNIKGFYRIPYSPIPGTYYAVTRVVHLPGYANTTCGKARSVLVIIS